MAKRALAKKITRKQARSYTRTVPNPIGVTAISAINGRGSYARRYAATRQILESEKGAGMRRARKNRGRAAAPAAAKKKRVARKSARKHKTTVARSRTYGGGKYRALRARLGRRTMPTFAYLTRKHRVRKIPDFALAGYRSRGDQRRRTRTAKGKAASWKRFNSLYDRRKKAAERISARILAGRYPFTPNTHRRRHPRTISFQEWEKNMIANARRRKSSKKRRKAKSRSKVRAKSRVHRTRRRRVAKRKRGVRVSKRVVRRSRRKARRNPLMQAAANRKRRHRRRHARRNPLMQAAANRTRRRRKHRRARRNPMMQAAANGRRRRRHHRKHYKRRHGRRSFKRNASAFVSDFVALLKTGAVVAIGLVAQKGATKWLAPRLAGMLNIPASFQNTAAGIPVAGLGMLLLAKYAPGESKKIGAGMAAGLVHTWLMELLSYVGQTDAASYLGDYTNAPGLATHAGYGSYYEFQPGQTYSGFGGAPGVGEYFTPGTSGFGGAPQLSQAAAGTGEYIVSGAQGIGEYEQVTPEYSPRTTTRDGIRPDLSAAEHALSVAEAAAGVGMYGGLGADPDVALQSTVYPQGQAEDIPDNPGGSRAGVFCGGNGVFGPCS